MIKDYIVQVKIKNGPLLRLLRAHGFKNVVKVSTACGISQETLRRFINLERAPMNKNGRWQPAAETLAAFFNVMPEDLFPPQHYTKKLDKNKAEFGLSLDEVENFIENMTPEKLFMQAEGKVLLDKAMSTIKPRDRIAFEGIVVDGRTLEDVANEIGVTKERVRQICWKVEQRLKRPAYKLKEAMDNYKGGNPND